jgi:integrase
MATKKFRQFTDAIVEAISDFKDDGELIRGVYWDREVSGLRLRVGQRTLTWDFFRQARQRGTRRAVCKRIGRWPDVNVASAREAARIIGGNLAQQIRDGRPVANRRTATKLATAFDDYVAYLERLAARRGKAPRWAANVKQLGKQMILPEWGNWSLAEMATSPGVVADWHRRITATAGPVSANRACQVIRALYKRACKTDLTLPKRDNPCAAVEFNHEEPAQKGLAKGDFLKWAAAWRKLPSDTRKAFHLCALLTGARPGELARLKWSDVRTKSRTLIIAKSKAGHDIEIPMSAPIAKALRMARNAQRDKPDELVFPGCQQAGHRDDLPVRGHGLRHTYETIARDLRVDDFLCHFLLGHLPRNISEGYVARAVLMSGQGMREAQRKISGHILALIKL